MKKWILQSAASAAALAMALTHAALLPSEIRASDVPDFSFLGAVGTLTAEQTAAAAEAIYESLSVRADVAHFTGKEMEPISATTENMDSLMKVFVTVIGGWDAGVLAKKNVSNCLMNPISNTVTGMAIYYWVDAEAYDAAYADVMAELNDITSGVSPSWSAPEKALYLHEYIAVHFDYDHDAVENRLSIEEEELSHTAYGMLKKGKAVCEGYTWLYTLLLRRVGVEAMAVTSVELNHTWNVLNIDGAWYHVDVTWDDYSSGQPEDVRHDNFLRSRSGMIENDHTSNDWMLTTGQPESVLIVSDRFDNAFRN